MRYFLYIAIIAIVYTGYSALTSAAETLQQNNINRHAQILDMTK
jgi:predicted amidophosphoribosyltransferase